LSCSHNREIKIWGFGYRGENIIIRQGDKRILNISVNGNEDAEGLCSFDEKIVINNSSKIIKLNVNIDSNGTNLLDTILNIPKTNREPFISFIHPKAETKFRRSVFVADSKDARFIKY
jgi:hypothetical protein